LVKNGYFMPCICRPGENIEIEVCGLW